MSFDGGRLVVVEGLVAQAVIPDLPFGYKFYVDDGSDEIQRFVRASTGIDVIGLALANTCASAALAGNLAAPMKCNHMRYVTLKTGLQARPFRCFTGFEWPAVLNETAYTYGELPLP